MKNVKKMNNIAAIATAKVNELIEATGAPESMIKRMIREGLED